MWRASAATVAAVEVNQTQDSRFLVFGLRTYIGDRLDVIFPYSLVVLGWISSSPARPDASADYEIYQYSEAYPLTLLSDQETELKST
jgi:hypothetical protein